DLVAILARGQPARADGLAPVDPEPGRGAGGDLLEGRLLVPGRRHGLTLIDARGFTRHALAHGRLGVVRRRGEAALPRLARELVPSARGRARLAHGRGRPSSAGRVPRP